MRTGQWKTMGIGSLIGKMIYAVFGLAASMLCIMGYYPVVPAFYTACCLDKKRNFLLYIGLVVGMGWCMPVAAIVKYLFILFVLGIAIRFYIWANRRCSGWTAGMIAGITTIAMNTSGLLILNMEKKALILGISEGVIVFALAVLFHYGIGMGSQIFRERHKNRVEEEGVETGLVIVSVCADTADMIWLFLFLFLHPQRMNNSIQVNNNSRFMFISIQLITLYSMMIVANV